MKYLLAPFMLVEFEKRSVRLHNWGSAVRRASYFIERYKAKRAAARAYRESDKLQPFIEAACARPMKQELLCCEAGPSLWSWGLARELSPDDPVVLKMEEEEKNSPAYKYAQYLREQEDSALAQKARKEGYEEGFNEAWHKCNVEIKKFQVAVDELEGEIERLKRKKRKSKKA